MQPGNLVGEIRQCSRDLIDAMDRFRAARRKFDAVGGVAGIQPHFEAGADPDIAATDVASGLTTADAFEAVMAQGHATNLIKLT